MIVRLAERVFRLKACETVAGGKSASGGPPPVSDTQNPGHAEGALYCAVRLFDPFRVGSSVWGVVRTVSEGV